VEFLNSNGVLYSFMALLLAVSLFAIVDSLNEQRSMLRSNNAFTYSFNSADSKFANVYSGFAILDKEPAARLIEQRNLPFAYYLDYNSLTITQQLPLKQSVWNNYFDLLNAYSIFLRDGNYSVFHEGFDFNVSVPKNSIWGGSASDMNFALSPQCLRYSLSSSLDRAGFVPSSACAFDSSKISKYSASVFPAKPSLEDYNSITYNISGLANPANPAFEFHFSDINCPKCAISSNKDIVGFFDPSASNWISVSCIGASCASKDINIYFGNALYAVHSGNRVDINFGASFSNFADAFYFEDLNIVMQASDFNILMSNN